MEEVEVEMEVDEVEVDEQVECGTVSVEYSARKLGIGRGLAYESCRQGTFPVPVIRVGSRYLIPRAALEQLLAGGAA